MMTIRVKARFKGLSMGNGRSTSLRFEPVEQETFNGETVFKVELRGGTIETTRENLLKKISFEGKSESQKTDTETLLFLPLPNEKVIEVISTLCFVKIAPILSMNRDLILTFEDTEKAEDPLTLKSIDLV